MPPDFLNDISIKTLSVPLMLNGATARGVLWQAAPGRFLLDVPDVARYLVEDGNRIAVEPMPQAGKTEVDRFLRMTPLAALLFQRGITAFHAAAAANGGGAVLLAGDSGSGKSTLLAALLKRGWAMLADDLAPVDLDDEGNPVVLPACREVMLWPDAMEKLGYMPSFAEASFDNDGGRLALTLPSRYSSAPHPLRAIYWLSVHHKNEIEIKELAGAERFRVLGTLSYNSHIADALLDRTAYFRKAAAISHVAPIRRLIRPRGRWSVEELADRVVGEWQ